MKLTKLLILLLLLSLKGFSQTPITSNITINQAWVVVHPIGPWEISTSSVTVTFGTNLVLDDASQYFIITGSNVTIDGAGKTATISGVTDYPGLVDASDPNAISAIIKNIGVLTNNSSLSSNTGFISKNDNKATISNCFSTGEISGRSGIAGSCGIAGSFNFGTINNCYSTGDITGEGSGGITSFNLGTINNCFSRGDISGANAGGIVGSINLGNIQNCYSTGDISGIAAGGIACANFIGVIFDISSNGNISNCYTSGKITGQQNDDQYVSGGITAYNLSTVTNSRSSGSISNNGYSVGIAEIEFQIFPGVFGTISNSINVPSDTWNSTTANDALTGVGTTVWNTSNIPYTLMSFLLSELTITSPSGTLTSNCAGVPSIPKTFGVNGSGLSTPVIITAPSNFEVSTSSDGSYSSSLTLPQASTVSQTVYIRLSSAATTNGANGIITANSSSLTPATTTVSSTTVAAPTFLVTGPYTLCSEGTYAVSLTVANSYNGWTASSNAITVNNSGYVTAGTLTGTYSVSYSDACAQTTSATVTVSSTSTLPAITDGLASYKFNNNPQGPLGSGNVIYMGYNGFNYSSTIRPTNTGFYKANNVSGSNAGSPTQFYIFRCTTCGTVSEYATRPQGTLSGNTSGTGQLTYTSSNGGGPFTIVYLPTGGSNVTVNNISSTVAFNVVTPTISTSYKLISVTDENTKATTDFSGISTSITIPYIVGQSALGGKIAYILQSGDPGYDANVQHGLVATVADISTGAAWGCSGTDLPGASGTAIGTGNQNTIDIMAGCATAGIAARLCGDLVQGGYSDWYLPSRYELEKLHLNRTAIGGFTNNLYWSSSETDNLLALYVNFVNGAAGYDYKTSTNYVRAIRAF